MKTMFDYIGNLPAWIQFTLILIWLIGSGGGILSIVVNYLKSANDARHKERLETIESAQAKIQNEQIRIQSEAASAAADRLNTQKLIEVISLSNERWQKVVDVKSERRLEADKMQHETNRMFLAAVERQTAAVVNLTEMLEISAEQFGNLDKTVQGMSKRLDTTMQSVEDVTQHNRNDLTTALGISVSERAAHDSTLRIIQQGIQDLRTAVNHTLSQNEQQKSQMLTIIDVRFSALEKLVVDIITPHSPALTPSAATQPIPDKIWDVDAEQTAIVAPDPHDEDNNPLLNNKIA